MRLMRVRASSSLALVLALALPVTAQQGVTTPEEQFGHEIGADYHLITYAQLYDYWHTLADESDRMTVHDIGLTEEGRPQIMAIITSPENHANLDRYRDISRRLAKAEGVTEAQAREMAEMGKAVIWIDGGLHATEVLGAQQLTELVYRMTSREDAETMRILDDVILLAVHANPDGMELVSNWYMREDDPMARSSSGIPVLYEKYAGHDNNRDFYMSALAETTNMNRVMYREWNPQIVYNHHQTGPQGTIMFAPPFRDPPNHNLDPLIITSLDAVGAAMHGRFVREGKGGTTMRSGAGYSTWWNGGLRTTPYFKNMIGLLTETIGHPNPIQVPFIPSRQLPRGDIPLPVEPGVWHFRQSIEYSQTANMAVLDFASRNRDHLLFNIWRMGTNSIERGNRDNWTVLPFQIDDAAEAFDNNQDRGRGDRAGYDRMLRDPAKRDARGYIIPSSQWDFATATKFVNALLKNGIDVHRATRDFEVAGADYPAGSYVVKAAQAFRPHVLDMFEPQQHPNDFAYPGGPPTPPYDNAGWTLALQMGVEFDRVLDGFDGPFELITEELATPLAGRVAGSSNPAGYLLIHEANDAFYAVNRVLQQGGSVSWLLDDFVADGVNHTPGTFWIEADGVSRSMLEEIAAEKGISFHAVASPPGVDAMPLRQPRIGLWDRYGGSMPSGWTRMILEDFGFDFEMVYPPDLDQGDLAERFDVLIFEDGAIPGSDNGGFGRRGLDPATVPAEYRSRIGRVTVERTVPEILEFVRAGGTAIAIGSSASIAEHAGLPVTNHLVDDSGAPLGRNDYFTPGSVHDLRIEHGSPITHGLGDRLNVLISHSQLFGLEDGYEAQGVRRVGWFDSDTPLLSGWAWGQENMEGGTALIEADMGDGKLFVFSPKITFRSQAHMTFPLLFNGIYYGSAPRRPVSF